MSRQTILAARRVVPPLLVAPAARSSTSKKLIKPLEVPPPDKEARKQIFKIHTRKKPLDSDVNIDKLVERVKANEATEVIIALSANLEGDTTMFYISRKLKDTGVTVSAISRGISIGSELEFADEITLGRSIINRTPYQA